MGFRVQGLGFGFGLSFRFLGGIAIFTDVCYDDMRGLRSLYSSRQLTDC